LALLIALQLSHLASKIADASGDSGINGFCSSSHHSCPCKEELPKLFQAMDRMEKMLERIESRQQKADSETKSVYTTVSNTLSKNTIVNIRWLSVGVPTLALH
jgi:thiamine kinase-like enzyme